MKSDNFYYRWHVSFWNDGEATVECKSVQIVTTSKPHLCPACNDFTGGEHPSGTRMMRDHAIVDGKWGTCYTCLPCIEKWAKECDPHGVELAA